MNAWQPLMNVGWVGQGQFTKMFFFLGPTLNLQTYTKIMFVNLPSPGMGHWWGQFPERNSLLGLKKKSQIC